MSRAMAKKMEIKIGTNLFLTFTFRHTQFMLTQLTESLRYMREYLRAYSDYSLTPELGNGRLHWHAIVRVKNVLKHKIFMHNWNAKYGSVHIRGVNSGENAKTYLSKEKMIYELADLDQDGLTSLNDIEKFFKKLKDKYYIRERVKNSGIVITRPLDITSFFNVIKDNDEEDPIEEEYQAYMNASFDAISDDSDSETEYKYSIV